MWKAKVQIIIAGMVGAAAAGWWFFDQILKPYGLSVFRILNGD